MVHKLCAQSQDNPEAKAIYERGRRAEQANHYKEALVDYQKAITLNPDFSDAYRAEYLVRKKLIEALYDQASKEHHKATPQEKDQLKADMAQMQKEYITEVEAISKKYPNKAAPQWAIGQAYGGNDVSKWESYCKNALHIDPKFTPAYSDLVVIASIQGDKIGVRELLSKAIKLQPDNDHLEFDYLLTFNDDPAGFKAQTLQFLKRFPQSSYAPQALYWLAKKQPSDTEKIEILEQLHREYPKNTDRGSKELFFLYDRHNPAKAQALIHELVKTNPSNPDLAVLAKYSDVMTEADEKIQRGDGTGALTILQKASLPDFLTEGSDRLKLLKAKALQLSQKGSEALDTLVQEYAKYPTDNFYAALLKAGTDQGKTAVQIDAEIWSALQANSRPPIPFSLPNFTDGKKMSLEDYKGHIVIVDFWFPGCGPCQNSFRYLQQIATKYKDKGITVLAINGVEQEESLVLPFLERNKYDFIALKGTSKWAKDVYHVSTFPSTFLIGADGQVYMDLNIYDEASMHSAELAIELLLAHS